MAKIRESYYIDKDDIRLITDFSEELGISKSEALHLLLVEARIAIRYKIVAYDFSKSTENDYEHRRR